MNAKKSGNLKVVKMKDWIRAASQMDLFLDGMMISEQ